jgi:hypothetical protein
LPAEEEAALRKNMLEKNSAITYRYCPQRAAMAREKVRTHYASFVEHYRNDLVVFPDGLSAAAAEQKRMEAQWGAASPGTVARLMKAAGLTQPRPSMSFPPEFLKCQQGIGAFFNPAEGEEFMREFNAVLAGFKKRGVGLTENELEGIRDFMESEAISPAFVLRLVQEHGSESIGVSYLIKDFQEKTHLAYLLRRFKGHFYRRRYPSLSLVGEDGTVLG